MSWNLSLFPTMNESYRLPDQNRRGLSPPFHPRGVNKLSKSCLLLYTIHLSENSSKLIGQTFFPPKNNKKIQLTTDAEELTLLLSSGSYAYVAYFFGLLIPNFPYKFVQLVDNSCRNWLNGIVIVSISIPILDFKKVAFISVYSPKCLCWLFVWADRCQTLHTNLFSL